MTASEALEQTWATVGAEDHKVQGYYHRRIPLPAYWPAHAGVHQPTGARILMLETDAKVARAFPLKYESKGYSIESVSDETGNPNRVVIRIQELGNGFREIFAIFCADILDHWIPHRSAQAGYAALARRLEAWKRFFLRRSHSGLTREEYVGLYGELVFIESGLAAGISGQALIDSWQGPLGANQDFLFGPVAVEVKATTGMEANRVRISNIRQLDSTGLENLFLARHAFDFRQGSGRTLSELAASLKAVLSAVSLDLADSLTARLLAAGFVDGLPSEHGDWGFTLRRFDAFRVADGFPRLVESDLPAGVSEVAFTVDLSVAAHLQVDEPDLWASIRAIHGHQG
jgi:Putative  PD-(D/E)XK family member, (DUF4420)